MNRNIIQQRLFEVISDASLINIEEEQHFETLNMYLESIVSHINFLDTTVAAFARQTIDENWDTYKVEVQNQVPLHEYGNNPKKVERDKAKIIYNLRLKFKDDTLSKISRILAEYGVM